MKRMNSEQYDPKDPRSMFKSKAFVAALLGLPTDVKDEALLSATAGLEIALSVIDALKESVVTYLGGPKGMKGKVEVTPEKLQFVMAVAGAVSMKSVFDAVMTKHKDAVMAAHVAEKSVLDSEQSTGPDLGGDDVGAAMEAISKIIGK